MGPPPLRLDADILGKLHLGSLWAWISWHLNCPHVNLLKVVKVKIQLLKSGKNLPKGSVLYGMWPQASWLCWGVYVPVLNPPPQIGLNCFLKYFLTYMLEIPQLASLSPGRMSFIFSSVCPLASFHLQLSVRLFQVSNLGLVQHIWICGLISLSQHLNTPTFDHSSWTCDRG